MLTLVTPVAADVAAEEQDLVGQVGAWFGLGEGNAVSRVAEGLINRNWWVATTAGTVAVKQVADAGAEAVREQHAAVAALARDGLPVPTLVSRPGGVWGWHMAISNRDISGAFGSYLERYPEEASLLSEPMRLLSQGGDFASRRSFPMHGLSAYSWSAAPGSCLSSTARMIVLQPGGHLEPADVTLIDAAERELVEETGIDPGTLFRVSETPVYVEYGRVPARPEKDEPDHFHLDLDTPSRRPMVMWGASRSPR